MNVIVKNKNEGTTIVTMAPTKLKYGISIRNKTEIKFVITLSLLSSFSRDFAINILVNQFLLKVATPVNPPIIT